MTARTFATLDPNALGSGLALDLGNLVVTTNQDSQGSASNSCTVFGTIPKAVGHAYFEAYFYSISRGDLTGLLSIGLAEVTADLDRRVGDGFDTWGLRPAEGGIWNDGLEILTGDPIAERICIGVLAQFDAPSGPTLNFFTDGSFYGRVVMNVSSSGSAFYVPAIGIDLSVAGDVSAFINFGQRAFDNQPSPVNS